MFRSIDGARVLGQLARLFAGRGTLRSPIREQCDSDPFDAAFQRKLERVANLTRRTQAQLLRPNRPDKRRGSGLEFAEYRDYVPGDDFRFVDPHAAMRLDKLYLRQFEEQEDQHLYLLLDRSLSMGQNDWRKLNAAKRLAAAIAFVALSRLDRVTITGLGETANLEHRAVRGRGQFPSVLRFLRSIEPHGATDLEAALRRFAAQSRRRGVAVLLTDLFDPAGGERGLDVLRYERFETTLLHTVDASDFELGVMGDHTVIDCETGATSDVTITRAVTAELRHVHQRFVAQVERHCHSHGIAYHAVDAEGDFEAVIRRLLGGASASPIGERRPGS